MNLADNCIVCRAPLPTVEHVIPVFDDLILPRDWEGSCERSSEPACENCADAQKRIRTPASLPELWRMNPALSKGAA